MKKLALFVVISLLGTVAQATTSEPCQTSAVKTLKKVAASLGLGKNVTHLGGTELLGIKTSDSGKTIYIFGGGVLARENLDGYISGSSATIEMIADQKGCVVNSIKVNTGADF